MTIDAEICTVKGTTLVATNTDRIRDWLNAKGCVCPEKICVYPFKASANVGDLLTKAGFEIVVVTHYYNPIYVQ